MLYELIRFDSIFFLEIKDICYYNIIERTSVIFGPGVFFFNETKLNTFFMPTAQPFVLHYFLTRYYQRNMSNKFRALLKLFSMNRMHPGINKPILRFHPFFPFLKHKVIAQYYFLLFPYKHYFSPFCSLFNSSLRFEYLLFWFIFRMINCIFL